VPFPIKVKINVKVKGVGQECPTDTGKIKSTEAAPPFGGWPRLLISLVSATQQGAPSFVFFLRRAGVRNACANGLITPLHHKSYATSSIAAHPCKKRKDGAPSLEMAHADIGRGGPRADGPLGLKPAGIVEPYAALKALFHVTAGIRGRPSLLWLDVGTILT
jgi:hypothetical protein